MGDRSLQRLAARLDWCARASKALVLVLLAVPSIRPSHIERQEARRYGPRNASKHTYSGKRRGSRQCRSDPSVSVRASDSYHYCLTGTRSLTYPSIVIPCVPSRDAVHLSFLCLHVALCCHVILFASTRLISRPARSLPPQLSPSYLISSIHLSPIG
jgi:hypothetical protein